MTGDAGALAIASAAADAGVLMVERVGAMAVMSARHPEALADPLVRAGVLAVARAQGIRDLAIELTDDDGAAPPLPRD